MFSLFLPVRRAVWSKQSSVFMQQSRGSVSQLFTFELSRLTRVLGYFKAARCLVKFGKFNCDMSLCGAPYTGHVVTSLFVCWRAVCPRVLYVVVFCLSVKALHLSVCVSLMPGP